MNASGCAGSYPLDRGCDCQSCVVWDRISSPVVGVEAPRSGSKLQCELGRTGVLLLGKEPLCIPPQELSTGTCAVRCHLSPFVHSHKVYCFGHCLWPHLSYGNAGNPPRGASGAVLTKSLVQTHQLCTQTCCGISRNQHRPQPRLHVHMPTKPVATGARPASAMEVPVVSSDVPQVQCSQSPWWNKYGSSTPAGNQLRFQPCLHMGNQAVLACSQSS